MSPTDTVRTADTLVDDEEVETPTRAELLELIDKMQQDWVQLNEYMNRTAAYFSWCSDYEERQTQYNRDFKVFKLQPRSDRQSENRHSPDSYLLPSLKRRMAEDNLAVSQRREAAIAAQDQTANQLRERERELDRRIRHLEEREREIRWETRPGSLRSQRVSELTGRLSEPRPAFRPPEFVRYEVVETENPLRPIVHYHDDPPW